MITKENITNIIIENKLCKSFESWSDAGAGASVDANVG